MNIKILIAEDEEITSRHLSYALKNAGYTVTCFDNGLDAWEWMQKEAVDILIADIKMPKMDGITLLAKVKEANPDIDVIIVTGFGSIESAVNAMKQGATDYITKPFNIDELNVKIQKILEKKRLEKENLALRVSLNPPLLHSEKTETVGGLPFVARSRAMKRVIEIINSIANSDCNVLITGESGVGKGLVAKLIHNTGLRKDKSFMGLNCATFTEELLASELFGHERGSFTGAVTAKKGLLEIADSGTLFMDEIAEMSSNLQAKLLKAIEDREFFRVGGTKPVRVDVRIIAATNQNINTVVSDGKFREDLYYRLNVMDIHIPPLRERREDLGALVRYFLFHYAKKENRKVTGFTKEAMALLTSYMFPGNVRELENIIERAVILEKTDRIQPENLPQSIKLFHVEAIDPNRIKTINEINRDYAEKVLEVAGGNKSRAAELLGISRTSLWRVLKGE